MEGIRMLHNNEPFTLKSLQAKLCWAAHVHFGDLSEAELTEMVKLEYSDMLLKLPIYHCHKIVNTKELEELERMDSSLSVKCTACSGISVRTRVEACNVCSADLYILMAEIDIPALQRKLHELHYLRRGLRKLCRKGTMTRFMVRAFASAESALFGREGEGGHEQ